MQDAVRLGLEFLILTATRTNEVQLATWTEINLDDKTWTIPGARMKSGREHRVPLVRSSRHDSSAGTSASSESVYVFPGTKPDKPLSNMTFLKAARRLTTTPISRRTASGVRSATGVKNGRTCPRRFSEAALAHVVKDKTEAAYLRTDLFDKRRDLMALWAQFVTSTPADVIPIRA